METLKKVQVEPSKMEIVNNVITQRTIDEIKEDDFYYLLEGVVATGYELGSLPGYGCHLLFIYNDKVCLKDYDTDENVCDSGMYIRRSEVGIHLLENKKTSGYLCPKATPGGASAGSRKKEKTWAKGYSLFSLHASVAQEAMRKECWKRRAPCWR